MKTGLIRLILLCAVLAGLLNVSKAQANDWVLCDPAKGDSVEEHNNNFESCKLKLGAPVVLKGKEVVVTTAEGSELRYPHNPDGCAGENVGDGSQCSVVRPHAFNKKRNVLILNRGFWESTRHTIISLNNGMVHHVADTPHISPSGASMISVSDSEGGDYDYEIEIVQIRNNDVTSVFAINPSAVAPIHEVWSFRRWVDDKNVELNLARNGKPDTVVTLQNTGRQWVFKNMPK